MLLQWVHHFSQIHSSIEFPKKCKFATKGLLKGVLDLRVLHHLTFFNGFVKSSC